MVGRAIKLMVRLALFSLAVAAVIVWLLFFSERPENQTDPFTLAGDGSALNYCKLPPLDGRGKLACQFASAIEWGQLAIIKGTSITGKREWISLIFWAFREKQQPNNDGGYRK